ncbi:MAG: cupredoxin domain-containing protein [Chloroflexota bacterium]
MFLSVSRLSTRARLAIPLIGMLALAACSGGGTEASATPGTGGGDCATADADNNITMSAENLAFSASCIEAPADTAFTITFENKEDVPHNIAIFTDDSKSESLFNGEIVTATTVTYEVPALPAGDYYFDCEVHPDMNGSVTAS